MFEAKVYTTAILSLSGMMDETHTARQTVSRFNQQYAATTGRLFLPVGDPQTADVVIGIVDNWVKDTAWGRLHLSWQARHTVVQCLPRP